MNFWETQSTFLITKQVECKIIRYRNIRGVYFMALLVAHHGFRSTEGENRIIDFQNALKICQAVEFDIRLTKDNKVIIFHDDTFERIANNKSEVSSLLYEEIINLEFFKNNKNWIPPLFNDFIEKLNKNYQIINVEIKEEINRKYTSNQLMIIFSEIKKLEKKLKLKLLFLHLITSC